MRVAIVGAGISGLVAADQLQHVHDVTLFEANDYIGGHTNTVDVEIDGEHHAIDTGFIVFNHRTYPNFVRLIEELGVRYRSTNMGFSVRDDRANVEFSGESFRGLIAQPRNLLRPGFYRMVLDILRFFRDAVTSIEELDEQLTVGQFLKRHRFSREFTEQFLLPMGSAIWSCPCGVFSEFPVRFVIEFYDNHGLLTLTNRPTWQVIDHGSKTYVRALLNRFRGQVRLNSPIVQVRRHAQIVELTPIQGEREQFDHVVFACHSDQALRILGAEATSVETDILSRIPYQTNLAVLHTDRSVLPKRRRAWASWNYLISRNSPDAATVTYLMNMLQGIRSNHTFCVTLNDDELIDPKLVLRRFQYHHPVFTAERSAAQARHVELLTANRTSFCGAYWGNGFHEAGVTSGLAVAAALQPSAKPVVASLAKGAVS
ncbi:NAD(P)/FAD-dependent oxidoreductase [Schlesneria paludicola]|uniref:NAD(P)/FAD-dependent oxidoreductase n=1 Tax=Schlesneria paludicola TaxID=360056 RepID=UPI00029B131A|nr:FAD-dependent oxidoreductase [Schlesneria paludicola]